MNELERINEAIKKLKNDEIIKDQAQIAADLGYNRAQSISDITTGRVTLTSKFVKAFCNKYGVDENWITSGKGEWKISATTENDVKLSKQKEVIALGKHAPLRLKPGEYAAAFGNWKGLPMFNTPVTASFIETYRDEKAFTPQYYLHDPRFRDCDFGAIITGDSMYAEIRHGDFIACKEIVDQRFIVFGDIYYVVATNGLETCKYVNADPNDINNLLLVPRNDSISPSPIPKDMVLKMYKVRGIIRGY
jgi:hypothetical protein